MTAVGLALLLDVSVGAASLPFSVVLSGIVDPSSVGPAEAIILWDIRLPDSLMAIAVGAALGLAGTEMQTTLNNPLASPFTLGLSSAAALGASTAILLRTRIPGLPIDLTVPLLAFAAVLLAAAIVLGFAKAYGESLGAIVLFGIALLFLCDALTAVAQFLSSDEALRQIVFWRLGDLTKAGWKEVAFTSAVVAAVVPWSLAAGSHLTALRGGEELAAGAGLDVRRGRAMSIVRVSLLTAAAVCFVGAIGFIGLVGPHIARMLLGEDHAYLLPGAAITGALLLSLASCLAKVVLPGLLVPVGIATAVVGVPVFVMLIVMQPRVRA